MYNAKDSKVEGQSVSPCAYACTGQYTLIFVIYVGIARIDFLSALLISNGGASTISSKKLPINDEITDAELRLIGKDGSQLGIVSAKDALKIAYGEDLDLVMIAPQATPPVCKIMDYSKYVYEQNKREKEAKKNQHIVEIKEIRLSLNIDTHDFETKGGHAIKFLKEGNKVKVSIRFRGREMGHPEIGTDIMNRFAEFCGENAVIEKPAKMESRNMFMFLAPKSGK